VDGKRRGEKSLVKKETEKLVRLQFCRVSATLRQQKASTDNGRSNNAVGSLAERAKQRLSESEKERKGKGEQGKREQGNKGTSIEFRLLSSDRVRIRRIITNSFWRGREWTLHSRGNPARNLKTFEFSQVHISRPAILRFPESSFTSP
jgi:hypothetical protein